MALYGEPLATAAFEELRTRLPPLPENQGETRKGIEQSDAILITYSDQLREPDRAPLHTLAEFCALHLGGVVSGVHLLPFYPYSSDDGFSVIDYKQVNPALGTWEDGARFGE